MALELLILPLREIKDMGIDFYINVLVREYRATTKFDDSSNTTIDLLDTLASKVHTVSRIQLTRNALTIITTKGGDRLGKSADSQINGKIQRERSHVHPRQPSCEGNGFS